jgi:hypothetical protein
MLSNVYLAQAEYRERVRRFNVRAARGEFVRDELAPSNQGLRVADRLRHLLLVMRNQWSRNWVQGLLTRTG